MIARAAAASVFGGNPWNEVVLEADISDSTGVAVNSGLEFTPDPNASYIVEAYVPFTTAATATGFQAGIYGLTSGGTLSTQSTAVPLTGTTGGVVNGNTGTVSANTTAPGGTSLCLARAFVSTGPAPVGTISFRFQTEVAASAVTVKAGAVLRYRKVL